MCSEWGCLLPGSSVSPGPGRGPQLILDCFIPLHAKSVGLGVTGKKDSDSCLEGNRKPLRPEDQNVLSTQLSGSLHGKMEETGF